MTTLSTQNIGDNQALYANLQQTSLGSVLIGNAAAGNVGELLLGTNLSISGTTLNASGGTANPSVSANDSNLSFGTGSNLNQLACNPTAARVYTLDNTFLAGQTISFKNIATTDGNYITIEANDGSIIAILPATGDITIVCLSSTPTTNTNWKVITKRSGWVNYSPTFTGFGTVSSLNAIYRVQENMMIGQILYRTGTSTATPAHFSLPSSCVATNSFSNYWGKWIQTPTGPYPVGKGEIVYYSSSAAGFVGVSASFTVGNANALLFNNTFLIYVDFRIPILY